MVVETARPVDGLRGVPGVHDVQLVDQTVHLAVEGVVLGPRLDAGAAPRLQVDLDDDVVAAERAADEEGVESPGFDAACARVGEVLLGHVGAHERVVLTGPLPEPDRQAVEAAVALWDGTGDAYLGNTWAEMVEVAADQLREPGAGRVTPPAAPGSR